VSTELRSLCVCVRQIWRTQLPSRGQHPACGRKHTKAAEHHCGAHTRAVLAQVQEGRAQRQERERHHAAALQHAPQLVPAQLRQHGRGQDHGPEPRGANALQLEAPTHALLGFS
jgi:hypothetical protein